MSGSSPLSDISSALPQAIRSMTRQYNRTAHTFEIPETFAGDGKNLAHDIELDGATAGSRAEGADFGSGDYNVDSFQLATLNWAEYASAFQITDLKLKSILSSQGGYAELGTFFLENVLSSVTKISSVLNQDCINGTGTDGSSNNNLVGLTGAAVLATGTYAGINRSTYPLWAGNVLGNGGTARPLSIDLFNQGEAAIHTATNEDADFVLTGTKVFRKYQNLFEVERRVVGEAVSKYDTGTTKLYWNGREVIRDKDWDSVASGSMLIGCKKHWIKKYVPDVPVGSVIEGAEVEEVMGRGTNGDGVVTDLGIPFKVVSLAKTGSSYKVGIVVHVQQLVTRPGAFALINDISTT